MLKYIYKCLNAFKVCWNLRLSSIVPLLGGEHSYCFVREGHSGQSKEWHWKERRLPHPLT